MTPLRLSRLILALAVVAGLLAPTGATALAAGRPDVSFTGVESQLMCTACKESLAVAQSPAADAERQYLRDLIGQGLSEKQIMANMVAVYSPAVLAKPPASGFDLTIYLVPPAVLLIGLATLAYFLPRWRARSRSAAAERAARGTAATTPRLSPADTARLDAELARSDGR
jgi:cytochrome c-type biogenesis protein CcmH